MSKRVIVIYHKSGSNIKTYLIKANEEVLTILRNGEYYINSDEENIHSLTACLMFEPKSEYNYFRTEFEHDKDGEYEHYSALFVDNEIDIRTIDSDDVYEICVIGWHIYGYDD
jgi:hypothetical protein